MSRASQESRVKGQEPETVRRSAARGGITLIEVLIAIFVLAVGLMGVAALLPVAQNQFKKGLIDQRAADLATKAFQDIETYGLDRPDKWVFRPRALPSGRTVPLSFDVAHKRDGVRYLLEVSSRAEDFNGMTVSFKLPDDLDDREALEHILLLGNYGNPANPTGSACSAWIAKFVSGDLRGEQRRVSNYQLGGTLTFAGPAYYNVQNEPKISPAPDRPFPALPDQNDAFVLIRHQPFIIDPFGIASGGGLTIPGLPTVSIAAERKDISDADGDGNTTEQIYFPMGASMAESIFVSGDDLTFDRSTDPKLNSSQVWSHEPFKDRNENGQYDSGVDEFDTANDVNGSGEPDLYFRRANDANYSWLAMFAPAEAATSSRRYQLSIVVFYKRHLNAQPTGVWLSFGPGSPVRYGGGSARLITAADGTAERMDQLKPGQWILVRKSWADVADQPPVLAKQPVGDQQVTTLTRNVLRASPIYRWYRLTSVGKARLLVDDPSQPVDLATNPWVLDVTLDGADWETQTDFAASAVPLQTMGSLAKAWIIDDIVGVFQRTIEVEDLPHGDYFNP